MAAKHHKVRGGQNNLQDIKVAIDDPMRGGIQSLWKQDIFVDYKIKVADREFNVHKLIMCSMSDYFRTMLTSGMAEGEADCVVIKGGAVSADVMEILIQYIYTNHMDISEENAADILGGAVYFQIKSAIKICTQFLLRHIGTDTWFDVLALFKMYSLTSAIEELRTYIKRNFTEIVTTADTTLPYEYLSFLVQMWQNSEYELFTFIMKWVKAGKVGRKQHADELLCNVRYSLMTPKQLSEMDIMKNFCDSPDSWDSLVDKAIEYHKLPLHQRVLDTSEQSRVRRPPSFVRIGDPELNLPYKGMYYDPLGARAFLQHNGLKTPRGVERPDFNHEVVVNNFLVVCINPTRRKYEFHIFDPRTLKWEKLASPNRIMTHTIFVHDNEHLYAIGGTQFPITILDSILQYDFQTNSWSEFSRLPVPLRLSAACVHNNSLYISGGIPVPGGKVPDVQILLQSVTADDAQKNLYRLDLSSRVWETKASLLDAAYDHEMHVMKLPDEDILCVLNSKYHMQVYSIEGDYWERLAFSFDKELMDFEEVELRYWVRGNSVYSQHSDICTPEVVGYQKVTIVDKEHGTVEDVKYNGGLTTQCIIRTVLAIPPHTSEPEFMMYLQK